MRKTVQEGDFEGYSNLYVKDAIGVFTARKNKTSMPMTKALAKWKKGFDDAKSGKIKADVEIRFYQRVGSETTAHESGIYNYREYDQSGKIITNYFGHLEMLLIKTNNVWKMIMEYQKIDATEDEWNKLSP